MITIYYNFQILSSSNLLLLQLCLTVLWLCHFKTEIWVIQVIYLSFVTSLKLCILRKAWQNQLTVKKLMLKHFLSVCSSPTKMQTNFVHMKYTLKWWLHLFCFDFIMSRISLILHKLRQSQGRVLYQWYPNSAGGV